MAWEWVSPVSSAGGAGLVLGVGWFFTARGWKHQRQLAEDARAHDAELAHQQWLRDRRAEAYIGFLNVAYRTEAVTSWALHGLFQQEVEEPHLQDPGAPRETIPGVTGDEIRQAHVLVSIYGSPGIRELAEEWRPAALETLNGMAWLLQIGESDQNGEVSAALTRLAGIRARVAPIISAELLHGAADQ